MSGGPLSGSQDADRAGPRRHRRGERADGREGSAGARLRRPVRRRRRAAGDGGRPDVADPGSGVRRHGRASSTRCAPEAKGAVQTALGAGIDVRMITGDHAVTAQAIGETLGLGPGAISGAELQALLRRRGRAPAARAARVRPGLARGQAAAGPADAGAGTDRRDDRRRGQRRRRAEAGRHRGGDGQRQRGHQAGRPHDPHRRQLRHAGARRRDRPPGLREGRLLRPLPDDPAAVAGHAVPRRHAPSTSTTASR